MVPALPPAQPLAVDVTIDSTTWFALTVVLTAVGLVLTAVAWRRRGPAAGVRALAWTLVPVAAWLTGTLRMFSEIASAVLSWATRLVFSPLVWAGVVVAGVSALLFVVSAVMRSRGIGVRRRGVPVRQQALDQGDAPYRLSGRPDRPERPTRSERKAQKESQKESQRETAGAPRKGQQDDEGMDEIEAILKKHGI